MAWQSNAWSQKSSYWLNFYKLCYEEILTAVFSYQKSRKNWTSTYEGVYLLTALFIALLFIHE